VASDAAARSIDADAFTWQKDIHFADGQYDPQTRRGLRLLAHETAHTVQGGAAGPPWTVGPTNDPVEVEAARAADRVVSGEPAALHEGGGQHATIHRFVGEEHRQIGEAGSGKATTDLNIGTDAAPELLTYGEMVAVAADYFESLDQMRTLAATQNGRDQIRWARWKAVGGGTGEPAVAADVRTAVTNRYFTLAASNISHFSAGGTARNSYQEYHLKALDLAFSAGRTTSPSLWNEAVTMEAFGNHYLTDMFSAGHVRTERKAIKERYNVHYPTSIAQLVTYMAAHMHAFLVREHSVGDLLGQIPSQTSLEQTIQQIGGPAIRAFSLGDIVSLAFHNRDNQGLGVTADVNEAGVAVPGGFAFTAMGDANLGRSPTTRNMAVAAVKASLNDLAVMRAAGAAAVPRPVYSPGPEPHIDYEGSRQRALTGLRPSGPAGPFAAERFIPREDLAAGNVSMNWHWGAFDANMRAAVDVAVKHEIAITLHDKAAGQTDKNRRDALNDFAAHLETAGIAALEAAVGVKAGP